MAGSVTPLVNMSSMVPSPKLKIIITPSACFTKLLKCNSVSSNMALSFGSSRLTPLVPPPSSFRRRSGFVCFAQGDVQSTEDPLVENMTSDIDNEAVQDQESTKESSDDEVPSQDPEADFAEEQQNSIIVPLLQSYKEAVLNNDESKISEIESFLQSIEEEKSSLEDEVAKLSEELLAVKDRVLRISADFDNYRKRTERDRLSLVNNVQGELVESLLPVLDNFERAKAQIKLQTEGEEKINSSYQSIYSQFVEILASLGVVPVETVGTPFDPLLHEAIMREDSSEFEEGIILQEFRKGFRLGDKLLRPSMVKVSAGPGPAKTEEAETSGVAEASNETSETGESS